MRFKVQDVQSQVPTASPAADDLALASQAVPMNDISNDSSTTAVPMNDVQTTTVVMNDVQQDRRSSLTWRRKSRDAVQEARGSLTARPSQSGARASFSVKHDPNALVFNAFIATGADGDGASHISLQFDGDEDVSTTAGKSGTFMGVYLPTCETMWGVLIYIKFGNIVGQAGILLSLAITWGSALIVALTATSVSALATNGRVTSQGPAGIYYILTRSLGPSVGGAVGFLYFVGLSVMSAVELVGFCEGLHAIVVAETGHGVISHDHYTDQLVFAVPVLILVGVCLLFGEHLVHTFGTIFLVVLLASYLSAIIGLFATAGGWHVGGGITGLSSTNFVNNLLPDFTDGWQLNTAITYLFPCFLGIFFGANNVQNLRRPNRSIPLGAFSAIATSLSLYTVILCLLGSVADRATLKENDVLFVECAWPSRWVAYSGLLVVGLGAGMQLLLLAPRVLRDIAADNIIPILYRAKFQEMSRFKVPVRSLALACCIALPFLFVPNLDLIAMVVTMIFLLNYAAVNITCALLSVLKLHSWRPKFRYYHPYFTAGVGCVLAVVLQFQIAWYFALAAVAAFLCLCVFIELHSDSKIWGSGVKGLQLSMAFESLISLEQDECSKIYQQLNPDTGEPPSEIVQDAPTSWTPQFLVLVSPNPLDRDCLMHFTTMLNRSTSKSSFVMVGSVVLDTEGSHDQQYQQTIVRKAMIQHHMQQYGLRGLVEVSIAPSIAVGVTTMVQMAGVGALRPNTVVAGWPRHITSESSEGVLSLLQLTRAHNKACMFLRSKDNLFPTEKDRMSGTIDLWWILQEGGMLLLIGYLISKHQTWRGCHLRLFTVAEITTNSLHIERQLHELLRALRVKATIKVVEMPTEQLQAFMNEWTLSRDAARQAAAALRSDQVMFPATVDQLQGVAHNHPELASSRQQSPAAKINNNVPDSGWTLDILRQVLERESAHAALVVLNLPVPTPEDEESPEEYVSMVNKLMDSLPHCVLISGLSDGTQAISVYQQ